jgi:hypothetical protein
MHTWPESYVLLYIYQGLNDNLERDRCQTMCQRPMLVTIECWRQGTRNSSEKIQLTEIHGSG